MNAITPTVLFRLHAVSSVLRRIAASLFVTLLLVGAQARAAEDRYWQWAVAKFGQAAASDPAQKATLWGEDADPDHDSIPNLVEYGADTDPLARTQLSDVAAYQITPGTAQSSYPVLFAWQRTDDPDSRGQPGRESKQGARGAQRGPHEHPDTALREFSDNVIVAGAETEMGVMWVLTACRTFRS